MFGMKIKIFVMLIISIFIFNSTFVLGNKLDNNQVGQINTNFKYDSSDGFTLFAPIGSRITYLINYDGQIVHTWKSKNFISGPTYLLENGSLLRGCGRNPRFSNLLTLMNSLYGKVEMIDWDGSLLWEFSYSDRTHCVHNDIEFLPNGNVLMIIWEYKTRNEAINAGINPNHLNYYGGILTDAIIEIKPEYPNGGNVIWEWHTWDHLIQDYNPNKNNYGNITENPQLFDINCKNVSSSLKNNLLIPFQSMDFFHINSVDYNPNLDQILITSFGLSEIFIIDHSTTIEESAGHSGGKYGKGGDLLYRWGNPKNYDENYEDDRVLYRAHDAQWITAGLPGEGNILIFNNGYNRKDGNYSSVEEIIPPLKDDIYEMNPDFSYGPEEPIWKYTAEQKESFYSPLYSGIQRISNGNTVICEGFSGRFFEISENKDIVWQYYNWRPLPIDKMNSVFKINRYQPEYPGLKKLFENKLE